MTKKIVAENNVIVFMIPIYVKHNTKDLDHEYELTTRFENFLFFKPKLHIKKFDSIYLLKLFNFDDMKTICNYIKIDKK